MFDEDVLFCVGWFYNIKPPICAIPVFVGLDPETYEVIKTDKGDLIEERL